MNAKDNRFYKEKEKPDDSRIVRAPDEPKCRHCGFKKSYHWKVSAKCIGYELGKDGFHHEVLLDTRFEP